VLELQIERLTGSPTWGSTPLRITIQSVHRKEAVSTSKVLRADGSGFVDLTQCEALPMPYFSLGDGVPSTDSYFNLKVQHAATQAVLCEGRIDCQSALTSSSTTTVVLHGSSGDGTAEVQATFIPHAAQQLLGSAAVLLRCFVVATTLFNQQAAQPSVQVRARWSPGDDDDLSAPVEAAPSRTAHVTAHDEFEWNAVFDLRLTAPVSGAVSITLCLDGAAVALCEVPVAALLAAEAAGQWRSLRAVAAALQRSRTGNHAEAVGELLLAGVLVPVVEVAADVSTTATATTVTAAAAAIAANEAALRAREPAALYVHAWDALDVHCLTDAALYLSVRLSAPSALLADGAAAGAARCCTRPVLAGTRSSSSSSGRLLWDEQLPVFTLQHCCSISSDGVCNAGSSSSDSSWTVELQLVNARALDKERRVLATASMPLSELWRANSSSTESSTATAYDTDGGAAKHSDVAKQPSVHSLTLRPCATGILAATAVAPTVKHGNASVAAVADTVRVRLAALLVPLTGDKRVAAQVRAFTQQHATPLRTPAPLTAPLAIVKAVAVPTIAVPTAVVAAAARTVKPVRAVDTMVNAEAAYNMFQCYADAADGCAVSATALATLCSDHFPTLSKASLPTTTAAAAISFEQFLAWLRSVPQSALSEPLLITPRAMLDSTAALEVAASQRIAALNATFAAAAAAAGASHSSELSCATAAALRERASTAWNSADSWAAHVAAAKSDVQALASAVAAAEAVDTTSSRNEQQQQQQCSWRNAAAELARRCLKLSQVLVDMKEALRRASDRFFAVPRPETTSDDDDAEQQQQQQWAVQRSDTAAKPLFAATVKYDKRQMLMRGRARPSALSSSQPLVRTGLQPVAAAVHETAVQRHAGITFDEPMCAALLAQLRAVVQLQAVVRDLRERCTSAATAASAVNSGASTTKVNSPATSTASTTATAATATAGVSSTAAGAATVKVSALETVQRLRAYQVRHTATIIPAVSDKQALLSVTAPPALQTATTTTVTAVSSPVAAVRSAKQSASKNKVSPALSALRQQRWDTVVSAMSEAGLSVPATLKDAVLSELTTSGVVLDRYVLERRYHACMV
jgi:hypothetical protein